MGHYFMNIQYGLTVDPVHVLKIITQPVLVQRSISDRFCRNKSGPLAEDGLGFSAALVSLRMLLRHVRIMIQQLVWLSSPYIR